MKDKRGFTLIELIVILALAGIILSVVMSFFIANVKSYNRLNTESELQYQSQYMINYMTNKILEAKNFNNATKVFNEDEEDDWFSFSIDGNHELYYNTESGTTRIGSYVNSLVINADRDEVTITLILNKDNAGDDTKNYPAHQTVKMRNYKPE